MSKPASQRPAKHAHVAPLPPPVKAPVARKPRQNPWWRYPIGRIPADRSIVK